MILVTLYVYLHKMKSFDLVSLTIAFFLVCAIIFLEDIDLFEKRWVVVLSSVILLISTIALTHDHPGLAFLSATLLILLMVRNKQDKFVVLSIHK